MAEKGYLENNDIEAKYKSLRVIALVLAVVMPLLVIAVMDHLHFLFAIITASPFLVFAVISSPPKTEVYAGKPYRKAGELLFANIGAVIIIIVYALFYRYRIENAGQSADIGMGLIMMTMPIVLVVGIFVFGLIGSTVGSRYKSK
jgi:hypothetical protein